MNKEERNSSDTNNEYDGESFDNESSEEVSSDEESISEESSLEESLDELLPDNSSIKSVPDSIQSNPKIEQNLNDTSSINSEEAEETPDIIPNDIVNETKNEIPTKISTPQINEHEIDESESDDLAEEELIESAKSLTIQNTENKLEVVVPTDIEEENPNSTAENNVNDGEISSCQESEIEFVVASQTPTSFNSDNYAFHMDILQKPSRSSTSIHQQRNSHRKSLSFSNERMREIERHNQILLRKILTQKPRKEFVNQKIQCPNLRMTTSAVNRRKQQRQIDLDNQVLKRKIEAIALRRPQIL
ncbi:cilia- and flagella-associated protein 97 [Episyrphus balteatus]|uniref:cilia- and flagella-associated protein 97 n=1 Tax=Episyrphus balteatus TaxID=286459 RepID=UPI0024852A94|nr:cilia- and flagella-associated protein 97 [Episyrphus balteatus]